MSQANIAFSPGHVRQWILDSRLMYPLTRDTEQFAGFSYVPVMPTLWLWLQERTPWPPVTECVDRLMQLADPQAIQEKGRGRIINRALKLTFDFSRELHCYALLTSSFQSVSWRHSDDLSHDVDFVISSAGTVTGVRAHMKSPASDTDWRWVKARRRDARGATPPNIRCFDLTNEREPERLRNGVWLFRDAHIALLKERMAQAGLPLDRPLF